MVLVGLLQLLKLRLYLTLSFILYLLFRVVQRKNRGGQGRTILDPNTDFLMPEDVTDAMMNKIHYIGRKVYDSDLGTSCHQCRQKTKDQKTICRSGLFLVL